MKTQLLGVDTDIPSVQIGQLRLIAVESVGGKTRVAARGLPEGHGPLFGHLVMDDEEWASVVDAVTFLAAGCQCARCQADEGRLSPDG